MDIASIRRTSAGCPSRRRMAARVALLALALSASVSCDRLLPKRQDLTLPPIKDVEAIYERNGSHAKLAFSGNVLVLTVTQSPAQFRHGGSLWARVGPYIYLFSPGTREVFRRYQGIAAVRAVTQTPAGTEIANARLLRDALTGVVWRRAVNLMAHAVNEGTQQPSRVSDLVRFGEDHTEHEYNRRFVPDAPAANSGRGRP